MAADGRDDDELERYTREEAIRIARAEAKRGYSEREDRIRYIAYVAAARAFCHCEFVAYEGAWIKTYRLLAPAEWLPDEVIQDRAIFDLARSGNMVSAVALYRAKHGVGLKEGLAGVQGLLEGGAMR